MNMKKVLAAVLAGTMVFGTATTIFAAPKKAATNAAKYDCWWGGPVDLDGDGTAEYELTSEEYEAKFTQLDDLEGDGTWSIVLKCLPGQFGDDQVYVFNGDVWDDDGDGEWCSYATNGDCWGDNKCSGQNTAHAADIVCKAGDWWVVEIKREGNSWTFGIYLNGNKEWQLKSEGSHVDADTVHTRIGVQFGAFDIYQPQEADAATALANVQAIDSASDEPEEAAPADDGNNQPEETKKPTVNKTSDPAPIVAVVVALAGCAAIAFASKKRFVK